MKKNGVREICEIAISVAILAVISQLSIPTPFVPLTFQLATVSLISYFLGLKKGSTAIIMYVLMGIIGVPVFSSFKGGFGVLISYTGGFIWGFVLLAILCALPVKKRWLKILLGTVGTLLCHTLGTLQYSLISKIDFLSAFLVVSLPYIIKDIILVILSFFLAKILKSKTKNRQ